MMKKLAAAALVVCGLALCAAAVAEDEGGARSVDPAWLKAIKANDVEAIVACYTPDAVLWLPDAPEARGTKAIRATYAGLLGANTVVDAALTNAVYQTSGDLSTAWGNFTLKLKPKAGGEAATLKGRFLSVSRRTGGKWAYAADLASNEPAPPPTAPAKP